MSNKVLSEIEMLRAELGGFRAANMVLRRELKTERLRVDTAVADVNAAEQRNGIAAQRNAELAANLQLAYRYLLQSKAALNPAGRLAKDIRRLLDTLNKQSEASE